ncbi:MAG: ATP-binding protein, partial [Arcobacteraceae bacterium]
INVRITIIADDGTIYGESDKDFETMNNHLNRVEIIQAKHQPYGSSIRYSNTIKKELLYVAKKFQLDETKYYIRIARDIELVNQKFFDVSLKISLVFLLFMASAFYISLRISKNVQAQTQHIVDFLHTLSNQKKAVIINSTYSLEFHTITKLLTSVSQSLSKKSKQKSKYTAKLKLLNRQKDDIISAISHEFKNPIAVISGYTQTLLEDLEINQNIREKFLGKVLSNAQKLTAMIDRLRLSTKLEENKQSYTFKKCNIKELLSQISDDLEATYKDREIIILGPDVVVEADETMFSIAMTNIIENALKYSQDNVIIEINAKYISIKDTGIGIKESDISKITNKFYRVSSNEWNNSLGIGLSLVKNIIELHKFSLEITSIENEGSTFKIVF